MHNKGQTILSGIVAGLFIFMAGMLFVNFFQEDINTMMGSAQLNCDDSTISDGTKIACLMGDFIIPYFIIIVLSVAGGILTERFLV